MIDDQRFYVVDENPAAFNLSPATLGGTSVRISLIVGDPDVVAARAVAADATEVFPVADQPYAFGRAVSRIHQATTGPSGAHRLNAGAQSGGGKVRRREREA